MAKKKVEAESVEEPMEAVKAPDEDTKPSLQLKPVTCPTCGSQVASAVCPVDGTTLSN